MSVFLHGVLDLTALFCNKGSDYVSEPTIAPAGFGVKVGPAEF